MIKLKCLKKATYPYMKHDFYAVFIDNDTETFVSDSYLADYNFFLFCLEAMQ